MTPTARGISCAAVFAATLLSSSTVMAAEPALLPPLPPPPPWPAPPPSPKPDTQPVGTLPVIGTPLATRLPRRHEGTQLAWDPAFNRLDLPEMILTGAAASVALATAIIPPLKTGWHGGIGFDDAVRNVLRPASFQARLDARDVSDVGLGLITTLPILVDSLVVSYWYRGSDDVALQLGLIDLEALTIAGAIQGTANFFGGRERPYGPGCGTQIPNDIQDCQSTSRYRSFFSGHSTLSFTSASLICAHHVSLLLYESAADPVACVSGYLAAASIATLRVVGDEHYASDVLIGSAVGTAVGLAVPLLHHYRRTASGTRTSVEWHALPTRNGAAIVGTF